jgi:hemerythrin
MEQRAGFEWSDNFLLGYKPMDDTHREFVERVDALLTADDAMLPEALAAFARHAEAHFAQEDHWMESEEFPARDCHMDEHAKVLASVRKIQQKLAGGDVALARKLVIALMEWFPGHADYLDSALATWLVKRRHAGAPLVFRRLTPSK